MSAAGQQHQQPAQQQTDRQAADVAEKQPRDRPVEWRETDHRAAKCQRQDRSLTRQRSHQAEGCKRRGRRHDFGDRYPVNAVHEVDEVHEPKPRNEGQEPLDPPRQSGNDTQLGGKCRDDGADNDDLQE